MSLELALHAFSQNVLFIKTLEPDLQCNASIHMLPTNTHRHTHTHTHIYIKETVLNPNLIFPKSCTVLTGMLLLKSC